MAKPAKTRIEKVLKLSFKLDYDDELGAVAVITAKTAVNDAVLAQIPSFLTKDQAGIYLELGTSQSTLDLGKGGDHG